MIARESHRSIVGWSLIIASFLMVGLVAALVAAAQDKDVSDNDLARAAPEGRLLEARRTLELATLDVVAVRMLDGVGVAGDRRDRVESAAADIRAATTEISTLAEGEGPAAARAEVLLGELDLDALDDPGEADLGVLFAIGEDYSRWSGVAAVVSTRSEAIQQLSFVSALPRHVLIEGIAGDSAVNEREVDPAVAEFVDEVTDTVQNEGGWFGIDPTAPLDDSIWIEIDEANEMLPEATEGLNELVASSDLVTYDAWMRELGDDDLAPPFELTEMLVVADRLQPELVTVIDQLFADEEAAQLESAAATRTERRLLLSAAVVLGGLSLALLATGLLTNMRAARVSRDRANLAARDALTGIGNRRELDERTRALATDPRFAHHLVAIVDLDSFKMINDLHGHAAGDAILVEVAARLQQVATRVEGERSGVTCTVIRLGGDEFLLSVHAPDASYDELVRAELDAIRGDSIDYRDERLPLSFSIGVVAFDGQHELAELMSEADLAVYDDKAVRARARRASKGDGSPADSDITEFGRQPS